MTHILIKFLFCFLVINSNSVLAIQIPAFPGATGYGAESIGGRGGRVFIVSNLNDSGEGSLREALESSGARIVIFRTAGLITLNSTIIVDDPFLTVAGQTAPKPGITIRMNPSNDVSKDLIQIRTHNVIVRYLKLRRGDSRVNGRNLVIQTANTGDLYNIILDHMSFSWSTDESVDIYTTQLVQDSSEADRIEKVTILNSIIAESLDQDCLNWLDPNTVQHTQHEINGKTYTTDFPLNRCLRLKKGKPILDENGQLVKKPNIHPLAMVIGGDPSSTAWYGIQQIDLHHNLFAHNTHRNPRVRSKGIKIVNNFIYNWFTRATETMLSTKADYIGNIFYHGPLSFVRDPLTQERISRESFIFHDNCDNAEDDYGIVIPNQSDNASLYFSENIAPVIPSMQDPSNDNWSMIKDQKKRVPLSLDNRRYDPILGAKFPIQYTTPTMSNMFSLLDDVGSNKLLNCSGAWYNYQDFVDMRVINESSGRSKTKITSRSRLYGTANEAGGYAQFIPKNLVGACEDSDSDGLPNQWEFLHGGNLDPSADLDGDGYTNIEEYINGEI